MHDITFFSSDDGWKKNKCTQKKMGFGVQRNLEWALDHSTEWTGAKAIRRLIGSSMDTDWLCSNSDTWLIDRVIFGVKYLPREDLWPLSSMTAVLNPFGRTLSACDALSWLFTSRHLNKRSRCNKVKSSSISPAKNQAYKRSIGICEAGLCFLFFATPLIFLWPLSFVLWPTRGVSAHRLRITR